MNSFKHDILRDQLDRNERLLWSNEPKPSYFKGGTIAVSIFGLFFLGFALFWIFSASSIGRDPFMPGPISLFPLFGIPFVIIGFLMIISPLFNYKSMKNTIYGVTNKRCIIIKGSRNLKVQSYTLDTLDELTKVQRADNTGDIVFKRELRTRYSDGRRKTYTNNIGFYNIPEVSFVERTIKNAIEASRRAPGSTDITL